MVSALTETELPVESEAAVEPLEWEVRIGDDQPQKRMLIVATALAVGFVGIVLMHQVIFGVFGALAVLLSTSEMFLPIRYRIDGKGASSKVGMSRTEIAWDQVKRLDDLERAVKLSPLTDRESRLEPFRGVTLRFSGNREAVLAKIRQLWGDE